MPRGITLMWDRQTPRPDPYVPIVCLQDDARGFDDLLLTDSGVAVTHTGCLAGARSEAEHAIAGDVGGPGQRADELDQIQSEQAARASSCQPDRADQREE